jgi:hypothetical protein
MDYEESYISHVGFALGKETHIILDRNFYGMVFELVLWYHPLKPGTRNHKDIKDDILQIDALDPMNNDMAEENHFPQGNGRHHIHHLKEHAKVSKNKNLKSYSD